MEKSTQYGLPPMVGEISSNGVEWKRMTGLKYEQLGYFLSCHLIIEHYIDEYLKIRYEDLEWTNAKLSFNSKLALISNFLNHGKYKDCISTIKYMNSLRNKVSHRVGFQITIEDLQPLVKYLKTIYENQKEVSDNIFEILDEFTSMVCVSFAGSISRHARKVEYYQNK
ncbi:hypothetical protein BS636_09825 [Acinetobacter sp. LoGeW2-3]|uniref:hypothetical protein n=1 Tax=Acinetobacter sp. LoGeW2-3 TaxID=1808001 RepID=UPI000C05C3C8|nr:hypothetical protein [Acinetobacter sp. LoGeW2-3]ATO19928.1 hypothetical protein BS636_09825 [Acinetobacter sp. LoGeW2-3]